MIIAPWHSAVSVKNLDKTIAFYTENLGFHLDNTWDSPSGSRIAFLSAPGFLFEMIQRPDGQAISEKEQDLVHFAFQVENLDAAVASLTEKGITFLGPAKSALNDTARIIFFLGPDGEKIELMEKIG